MGFGYELDEKDVLFSTIIDLYRMYRYVKELKCQVKVVTDIKVTPCLIKPILDGSVDVEITLFLERIKGLGEYVLWTPSLEWKDIICWERYDKIIFYYTGHGVRGHIIVPKHDYDQGKDNTLSVYDLRDIIISHSTPDSQILCLFDSCFAPTLCLPFYFANQYFKRQNLHSVMYSSQHVM